MGRTDSYGAACSGVGSSAATPARQGRSADGGSPAGRSVPGELDPTRRQCGGRVRQLPEDSSRGGAEVPASTTALPLTRGRERPIALAVLSPQRCTLAERSAIADGRASHPCLRQAASFAYRCLLGSGLFTSTGALLACSRGAVGESACPAHGCAATSSQQREAALLGVPTGRSSGYSGAVNTRWPDPCRGLECVAGWPACTYAECEAAKVCGAGGGGELFVRRGHRGEEQGTQDQPFGSLAAAVAGASTGAVIHVAEGVYDEAVQVRDKAVHLCGGWSADFSTRDAERHSTQIAAPKNEVAVTLVNARDSSLVGFVVKGARLGVWVDSEMWPPTPENSAPRISGNVIEGNGVLTMDNQVRVGAIAMGNGYLTVAGNTLRDNRGEKGAALALKGKEVTVVGNRVVNNAGGSDHGGAVYAAVENATLGGNLFAGNTVGALAGYGWGGAVITFGTARLVGNVWTDNAAPSHGGGLFVDEGSQVTLDHDVFFANRCSKEGGDAIAVDGAATGEKSRLNVSHATIVDHVCPGQGAILLEANAELSLWNSVVWNPEALDLQFQENNCSAVLAYSTIAGIEGHGRDNNRLTRKEGCLDEDPAFVAPEQRDYHLTSEGGHWDATARRWVIDEKTSPAVDAGDPAAPFGGEATPHGNRVNQGAFGNTPQASRAPRDRK